MMPSPSPMVTSMNEYYKITAYTNGYQIVILGDPPEYDESDPNSHNCDEMGCGSLEHVLDRIPIMRPLRPGVIPAEVQDA